ncbi:hypothetical protein [Streptomyces sp. NPDC001388]|uniref:hypothetical protein n=1 Tax=Streptomyces sp. NPDC001388 TaxID=3364568 RepID=UPI00368A239A
MAVAPYQYFSFKSGIAGRLAARLPESVRSLGVPLHNLGVAAIYVQMCLVYVVSDLFKVQGAVWQDGTTLFLVWGSPRSP